MNKTILAWILLAATCLYSGFYASESLSTNSDAIVYPYLFQDFKQDMILVSEKHSNLLKMPIFALQSLIPYNHFTFTLFNVVLFGATITLWCWLLIRILGKKYSIPILMSATYLIFFATSLNTNLIYLTVRNIEYPLILWFGVEILRFAFGKRFSQISITVSSLLLAVMLAGDHFFRYTFILPLLIVLAVMFISKRGRKKVVISASIVMFVVLSSLLIQSAFDIAGLYDIDRAYLSGTKTEAQWYHYPELMKITIKQSLQLLNINAPFSVLLKIVIILTTSLSLILSGYYLFGTIKRHPNRWQSGVISLLVLVAATTVAAYLLGGFAGNVHGNAITPSDNSRYLTLIPLLLIPLIAVLYIKATDIMARRSKLVYISIIFAVIAGGLPATVASNNERGLLANKRQHDFLALSNELKRHNVNTIISGYWTGATTRFWSDNKINYAVAADCNRPSIENSRRDWYSPMQNVRKSALVIDMKGGDLAFLGYCGASELEMIYGKPSETTSLVSDARQTNIWIYNYDIRSKLRPVEN